MSVVVDPDIRMSKTVSKDHNYDVDSDIRATAGRALGISLHVWERYTNLVGRPFPRGRVCRAENVGNIHSYRVANVNCLPR